MDHIKVSKFEYSQINKGPLSGKGFARLTTREDIVNIYGKLFDICSVDSIEYTIDNENQIVSEWVIICEKK